jgi:hypothetical protein
MSELTKDSRVVCGDHGPVLPTFVCRHLVAQSGTGFNVPDEPVNPEWPFRQAWCDECDALLMRVGEWNDESEAFAGITMICEICFDRRREARQR